MARKNFHLLFFGSDRFSIVVLEHLLKTKICPIEVVTGPFSKLGRFSREHSIQRHDLPIDFGETPSNIGLVASYGRLIDVETITRFPFGLFNVHPSLLPQFRGSTPIQAAIFNGLRTTGCTIMRIPPVAKFDIGDVILQEELTIGRNEFAIDLQERLASLGAQMAEKFLLNYEDALSRSQPQSETGRSYAKKLKPEDGFIKFTIEDRDSVYRRIRAFTGFIEIFMKCLGGLKVRLEGAHVPEISDNAQIDDLIYKIRGVRNCNGQTLPGQIFFHKPRGDLLIKCADGRWISFDGATPTGKPKMNAREFYNGYLSKIDDPLMRRSDY